VENDVPGTSGRLAPSGLRNRCLSSRRLVRGLNYRARVLIRMHERGERTGSPEGQGPGGHRVNEYAANKEGVKSR